MGSLFAPTSVRELVAQGLSPLEIKRKAEEYQRQGKILWGWPEYCLWHFYNPRTHQFYASMAVSPSFREPVALTSTNTAKPAVEKDLLRQKKVAKATRPQAVEPPAKKLRRVTGNWEEALAMACRLDPNTPVARYINDLSFTQRKVVKLKYLMGKTNDEVARECHRAPATVTTTLSQAYSRIRKLHNQYMGGANND